MKRLAALLVLVAAALTAVHHGPATVHASTAMVCASGCRYSSISAAVNAATPGATITVGPGCFIENLFLINLPAPGITIQGAGPGNPPVDEPPAAGDPCLGGTPVTGATYIDGNCFGGVTGQPFSNPGFPTVFIVNSMVTIEGVTIQDGCIGPDLGPDFLSGGAGIWNSPHSSTQLVHDWVYENVLDPDFAGAEYGGAGIYNQQYSSIYLLDTQVQFNADFAFTTFNGWLNAGGIHNELSTGFVPFSSSSQPPPARPRPAGYTSHPGAGTGWPTQAHAGALHAPPKPSRAVVPAHAGGQGAPQPAGPLNPPGSPQSGVAAVLQKGSNVENNFSFGAGGIFNWQASMQINYSQVSNNPGQLGQIIFNNDTAGSVGGIWNDDGTLQINSGLVHGNLAQDPTACQYYTTYTCLAGGLAFDNDPGEGSTALTNTPVTGNTVSKDFAPLDYQAGGIGALADTDSDTWTLLTLRSSPLTGNTPPQCGPLGTPVAGTPPC